ncbi:MAG: secondary thiamine-phosphate synthase enzyme YjbQ [Thermoproteus sp.]|nr:secondary thiamine-phosphate synthase enzyme YjbQ [Thermoproteus sp.]
MKIYTKELSVKTSRRRELVNVTGLVEGAVGEAGVREGIALVFAAHATAALFANEDEPNIRRDYEAFFERLAPRDGAYEHNKIDDNADAHLLSALLKQFYVFPVKGGRIVRGTWQELFLAEFDGPRNRRILVVVVGE